MFYLKQLVSVYRRSLFSATLTLVLGTVLSAILLNYSFWQKAVEHKFAKNLPGNHFFCLVDSKNSSETNIVKIKVLPGVARVEEFSESEVQQQIKDLIGDVSSDDALKQISLDYIGLKIQFENSVSESSQNLIREYVKRLLGENNVTIGPIIKSVDEDATKKDYNSLLVSHSLKILLSLIFIVWLLVYSSFISVVRETAFLVEKFQRKKMVSLKITLLNFVLIILFSILTSSLIAPIDYIFIPLIVVIFGVVILNEMKGAQWHN